MGQSLAGFSLFHTNFADFSTDSGWLIFLLFTTNGGFLLFAAGFDPDDFPIF